MRLIFVRACGGRIIEQQKFKRENPVPKIQVSGENDN